MLFNPFCICIQVWTWTRISAERCNLLLPAATSRGAVARGKGVGNGPASLMVDDDRSGIN